MTRRGLTWLVWLAAGAVLLTVGIVLASVGLETADKLGSVIGALSGLIGLVLSAYALLAARREKITKKPEASPAPEVHQSVTNSWIGGSNIQIGSVRGDAEIDQEQ